MGRTKKVGPSGRFGARYGKGVKKRIVEIERTQRKRHNCPNCLKPGIKRISPGIWGCRKCGLKFAGRAYDPKV
ncbi:MAG: 50S ribosomal protein L37ae [Candidatus Aenigmarchaeota archaeon]|nr:50S ribosomal protein L37ae [Candidatus Aenigmarchaeota archaeon]